VAALPWSERRCSVSRHHERARALFRTTTFCGGRWNRPPSRGTRAMQALDRAQRGKRAASLSAAETTEGFPHLYSLVCELLSARYSESLRRLDSGDSLCAPFTHCARSVRCLRHPPSPSLRRETDGLPGDRARSARTLRVPSSRRRCRRERPMTAPFSPTQPRPHPSQPTAMLGSPALLVPRARCSRAPAPKDAISSVPPEGCNQFSTTRDYRFRISRACSGDATALPSSPATRRTRSTSCALLSASSPRW